MLGVGGWKTIVGVFFAAFAAILPQLQSLINPMAYRWLMIISAFVGTVLTGLGIAHKIEKGPRQIALVGTSKGNQAGSIHIKVVSAVAALCLFSGLSLLGCAKLVPPTSNVDASKGPVCDRVEFADSMICAQLRAHGIANAEDARDLILDLNDISLLLEFYTTDQLSVNLDKWDKVLSTDGLTYALYMSGLIKDVAKVSKVVAILKRRFGYLLTLDNVVRQSDLELLRLLNARIREASGIAAP